MFTTLNARKTLIAILNICHLGTKLYNSWGCAMDYGIINLIKRNNSFCPIKTCCCFQSLFVSLAYTMAGISISTNRIFFEYLFADRLFCTQLLLLVVNSLNIFFFIRLHSEKFIEQQKEKKKKTNKSHSITQFRLSWFHGDSR